MEGGGRMAALGLAAGVIAVSVLLALVPAVQRWSGDVTLFEHYAGLTFSGYLGRTAFLGWYPPAALIPIGLPRLLASGPTYILLFGVEMAAVTAAGLAILQRSRLRLGADARAPLLYAGLALLATAVLAWRYDALPAVLTLAALAALASNRFALGGIALGAATALKLYTAPLAPVLILWAWRRGGMQAAISVVVGFAGIGVLSLVAYLLFPPASPLDLLAFTGARPVQVETLPGAVIALAAALGIGQANLVYTFGSFNLVSPAADGALAALRVAQPLVLGGVVALACARVLLDHEAHPRTLAMAPLAVLLALVVTNRVLSPQYLVWVLPLVPLATGWIRWLLAGALALTVIVFPWLYDAVTRLETLPLAIIVLRNLLLAAALAFAVVWLARSSPQRRLT